MISRVHPADMASILDELPPAHVVDIFHTIADTEMAAEVFTSCRRACVRR
jgi:Mg/Co/Ni transporter MgtE